MINFQVPLHTGHYSVILSKIHLPFQEHFTEMKVCQGEETIKIVSAGNESMIRYGNSLKEGTDKYGLIHTSAYGSTIITK